MNKKDFVETVILNLSVEKENDISELIKICSENNLLHSLVYICTTKKDFLTPCIQLLSAFVVDQT
jgi:hypothetical protein